MTTKTKVIKKIVCDGKNDYQLTYSLLSEDDCDYGIEVVCRCRNVLETECIRVGNNRQKALSLLWLFAKETVFPVALKETYDNL